MAKERKRREEKRRGWCVVCSVENERQRLRARWQGTQMAEKREGQFQCKCHFLRTFIFIFILFFNDSRSFLSSLPSVCPLSVYLPVKRPFFSLPSFSYRSQPLHVSLLLGKCLYFFGT